MSRATSGRRPFITRGSSPSAAAAAAVTTVAGRTGDVVLAEADITGLVADLAAKAPSSGIAESAVTNLVTDLAAKMAKASNLSDVASATTARSNLGIAGGGSIAAGTNVGDGLIWDGTNWIKGFNEMNTRGFKAWTGPPQGANTNVPVSQSEVVTKIWLPYTIQVSTVVAIISTAGGTLTSSQNLITLYDQSGTKLGSTADQSAVWTTAGIYAMALTGGPFTLTGGYGNYCWLGILSNGTTPATFRTISPNTQVANAGSAGLLTGANLFAGRIGTTVTAPASFTPSSLVSTAAYAAWLALA